MKILIVDDEDVIRDSLSTFLRSEGHSCRVASNGFEALQQLTDDFADVIISDMNMPDMSGAELVRHIRSEYDSDIYIVMMTGSPANCTALDPSKYHISKVFKKPIEGAEIRQFLGQL